MWQLLVLSIITFMLVVELISLNDESIKYPGTGALFVVCVYGIQFLLLYLGGFYSEYGNVSYQFSLTTLLIILYVVGIIEASISINKNPKVKFGNVVIIRTILFALIFTGLHFGEFYK